MAETEAERKKPAEKGHGEKTAEHKKEEHPTDDKRAADGEFEKEKK
jgi:hypothetical protein